ncbi:MAG: NAD(P)H-binding protein [bacterium]
MHIAVLGGTGMVGSRIVSEASGRGHRVTAVSRSGGSTDLDDVTELAADAGDPAVLRRLAADHDVLVCATGPNRTPGADHSPYLDLVKNLITETPPARLFVVGGAGSLFVGPDQLLVDSPQFPPEYREESLTGLAALNLLRASRDVEWTYLSPAPVIAPGRRSGSYTVGDDNPVGDSITAEDFAVAVLDELENPTHPRRRFTVAA